MFTRKIGCYFIVIKINMFKDNAVNIVIKCVFKSEFFYELLNLK